MERLLSEATEQLEKTKISDPHASTQLMIYALLQFELHLCLRLDEIIELLEKPR